MKIPGTLTMLAGLVMLPAAMQAASLTMTGFSGANTASLTFNIVNNSTLQVTLSNTSLYAATSFTDVLTGFFFSSDAGVLTPSSVSLASGSSIVNCGNCLQTTDISSHYLYQSGVVGLNGSTPANVLGAADFGFLSSTVGSNVLNKPGTNGVDFGLVSNNTSFGQSAFTGSPLITRSIVVNYSISSGFNLNAVSGGFLWGPTLDPFTNYLDYSLVSTSPEPGSFFLLAAGLAGLALVKRRARGTR